MRAVGRLLRVASLVLLGAVVLAAAGTGSALAATRLTAPIPAVTPVLTTSGPWAAGPKGSAAIAAPGRGSLALAAVYENTVTPLESADAGTVRPIASVAKAMTALVILEAHPVLPGQAGPSLTMTQQDVDDYHRIAAGGGSYAPVILGERLTERDLLIGLMLPSANNFALTAARWVDGTVASFVRRLNARAVALGMLHTHFADPDGLDQGTTSTAADLLLLGETVVNNESLVGVVSTANATLPDGTAVRNLNILLGSEPGWVGVKTGWTPAAGGCLLFAARRTLSAGAPALTMVGAVLGQPADGNVDIANPELGGAFDVARSAVDNAYTDFSTVRVGPGSIPVTGHVRAPWASYTTVQVSGPDRFVLLHSGDSLSLAVVARPVMAPAGPGTRAGTVTVTLKGMPVGTWTLATVRSLSGPSPWWRLLTG
jgi:D-alanyl-D-alanine carboxypeptidase (penicillin-binding protein 5/6)